MSSLVRPLLAASLAALVVACAAPAKREPAPLAHGPPIDLARYMGDWYVIANIPYFAERNKVATLDRYALLYNRVIAELGDEGFGLFSVRMPPGCFEFLCRGMLSAPTLAESLDRARRFLAIVLPDLAVGIHRAGHHA